MGERPITWQQGIAVVGGAFGLCCMGFMLLHGMVINTRTETLSAISLVRTEAADNLSKAVRDRTAQMDRISDQFASYQKENNASHEKIMVLLMKLINDPVASNELFDDYSTNRRGLYD